MNTFTQEELVYLLKQKQGSLDMIAAGMIAIVYDTEKKCESLQSTPWVKRLFMAVCGTKKPRAEMIQKNATGLCAYCIEALSALLEHDKISGPLLSNLEERVKELYASRNELKYLAGAFAKDIACETGSAERYFTLYKEIELDRYGSDGNPFWLYRTMAEIDADMIRDERKMELLTELIFEKRIVPRGHIKAEDFIGKMFLTPDEHAGAVYMELLGYAGNTTAELAMAALERWNMQSRAAKQYLKKEEVSAGILKGFGVDPFVKISLELEFDDMVETKIIRMNAAAEEEMLKSVIDLEREARQKERQQEMQAKMQENMQGLKSNAQELQTNVSKNVQKGMKSLGGLFGRAKDNVVNLARKRAGD